MLAEFAYALVGVVVVVSAIFAVRQRRIIQGRRAFHSGPMQSMLGAGSCDATSARIWGRLDGPGRCELSVRCADGSGDNLHGTFAIGDARESDGTFCLKLPDDLDNAVSLSPGTRYLCEVQRDTGDVIGSCHFETAPASHARTPERFAIAAMSCHQPFDDYGRVSERAAHLLDALPDELTRWNVKRVLLMGDQVYGDLPKHCSLLNPEYFPSVAPDGQQDLLSCSRQQVRQLYQQRHRIFWKTGPFLRLQSAFACHPILDDHEIIDNFGSGLEHSSPKYAALRAGALDAFYDYQGKRCVPSNEGERPEAFDHSFEYGSVGVYIMDLRSERSATRDEIQAVSERQFAALSAFLDSSHDRHVILLVLSVPILHVPDWLAEKAVKFTSGDGDVEDRWSNPKTAASRNRLLTIIRDHQRAHPKQRFVILGGDVHIGMVTRFEWEAEIRDTYQLVSSAITNDSVFKLRSVVEAMPKFGTVVGHDGFKFRGTLMPQRSDLDGAGLNPCGELNCGIVEVERLNAEESTVRLLLLGLDKDDQRTTRVVFDSGRL